MIFFIIILLLFLILLSRKMLGNNIAFILILVYLLWYSFWLCLSTYNVFHLYEVSYRAYLYQLLGVVMLTFGFLAHQRNTTHYMYVKRNTCISLAFEKSWWYRIFVLICMIYLVYIFIAFRNLVLIGGDVRNMYFYEDKAVIYGHRYLGLIWGWIGYLLFLFSLLLLCVRLINYKFFSFWTLIYAIFVILYGFIGAGRQNYIVFMEMLFFVFILNLKTNVFKFKKRSKLKPFRTKILIATGLLVLVSIVFLSLGYMTSIREGNAEFTMENSINGLGSFFEQVIVYNIGPFRAFDYALSSNYIDKIGQLFGRGTLASLDSFIYTIFTYLRLDIYVPANHLIGTVLQGQTISIGNNQTFLYAYTQFLIFYLDFKVIGIIICSYIFGFYYRKAVNYFLINPNFFSSLLLLFLSLSLLGSNFSYGLQSQDTFVLIAGLLYLSSRFIKKSRQSAIISTNNQ